MEFYQHAAAVTAERREVALSALRWFEPYEEVESCCITSCSCCPRLLDGVYAWAHTHTSTHYPALSLRNSEEEQGLLVRVISFFMVRHSWQHGKSLHPQPRPANTPNAAKCMCDRQQSEKVFKVIVSHMLLSECQCNDKPCSSQGERRLENRKSYAYLLFLGRSLIGLFGGGRGNVFLFSSHFWHSKGKKCELYHKQQHIYCYLFV